MIQLEIHQVLHDGNIHILFNWRLHYVCSSGTNQPPNYYYFLLQHGFSVLGWRLMTWKFPQTHCLTKSLWLCVCVPKNVSKDTQTANQTATPENKGCAWTNNEYHAIWTHKAILHSVLNTVFVYLCASNQFHMHCKLPSVEEQQLLCCCHRQDDTVICCQKGERFPVSVWCCFQAFRAKYILDLVELGSLLFVWTRLLAFKKIKDFKPTLVTQYCIARGLRCKRSCDLLPTIGRSRGLRRRREMTLARQSCYSYAERISCVEWPSRLDSFFLFLRGWPINVSQSFVCFCLHKPKSVQFVQNGSKTWFSS